MAQQASRSTNRTRPLSGMPLGRCCRRRIRCAGGVYERAEILNQFGPNGITRYAPAYGGLGTITDDTQMTLFTAEGLIRAWVRGRFKGITTYSGVTARAYQRWLQTQGEQASRYVSYETDISGWLIQQKQLRHRRAPGNTCLSALRETRSYGEPARNDSKGCGGVMRVAPAGLFQWCFGKQNSLRDAFQSGTELAALTHGHPTGNLTDGVLAALVLALTDGATLPEAMSAAKALLQEETGYEETLRAIEMAEKLAATDKYSSFHLFSKKHYGPKNSHLLSITSPIHEILINDPPDATQRCLAGFRTFAKITSRYTAMSSSFQ